MTTVYLPYKPLLEAVRALETAGIENARFEAQLLLALALGVARTTVLAGTFPAPTEDQQRRFERLVHTRAQRVPLAYLRGTQEFYGLSFQVSPAVLIPRPETEMLVEFALEKLREPVFEAGKRASVQGELFRFADVGTGSGCIAIAVLAACRTATALAVDVSAEALALAWNNAARNGVSDRVRLVQANLLDVARDRQLDLILSNPPYIPSVEIATLEPEVRAHEPLLALDGGRDGLTFHRGLARAARRRLKASGWIAVEVSQGQAPTVARIFREQGLHAITIRRDLARIERLVFGQNPSEDAAPPEGDDATTGFMEEGAAWT